MHSY